MIQNPIDIRWPAFASIAAKVDFKTLPDAHIVVGGAMCQPFSTQGAQLGWADERAQGLVACLECIIEQASRPNSKLIAFVLENVEGLGQSTPGKPRNSPLDEVYDALADGLGEHWRGWSMKLNTRHLGLPQNRSRFYILGRLATSFGEDMPQYHINMYRLESLSLRCILDPELPALEPNTSKMKKNLVLYKGFLVNAVEEGRVATDEVMIQRADTASADPLGPQRRSTKLLGQKRKTNLIFARPSIKAPPSHGAMSAWVG